MKKDKLIKMLSEIPGNPDITLWNGMVGDWMDIGNLVEGDLVKQTLSHHIRHVQFDECKQRNDWTYELPPAELDSLKKSYRSIQWDHNPFVTQDDIKEGHYKSKRVVYINAKTRGISTWDRLGQMSY